MYAAEFEYLSPVSLQDVLSLLDRHGDDANVLAGGQSLVPMINLRLLQPRFLIDLKSLLAGDVGTADGWLRVPAGTRHRQLAADASIASEAPLVAEAARLIGNVRVRSLGTIGGSVAHADPAAELPCVLTALGAEVAVVGTGGARTVPAGEFFITYLTPALEPGELVSEIRIPRLRPRTGQAFAEVARRASDFAVVEAAAVVELDRRDRCQRVSLVFGGVKDTPLQATAVAEEVLGGQRPGPEALADVARRARSLAHPHDDVHGSAAYRQHLIEKLARRVLQTATERAGGRI